MRVFVTGGSGWIGSAVIHELLGAGHAVLGLACSEGPAQRLEAAGAIVQRGDVNDPESLAKAANHADGVIHLAFEAWSDTFADAARADRWAVEAIGEALADSGRPFVVASGMLGLTAGRVATEDDGLVPSAQVRASPAGLRLATGLVALSLRGRGVRSSVLRLPPAVHGDSDHGFMATLVGIARQRGVAGYVGDGQQRWPAVHRSDAARLARLAIEGAPAGSVMHAVGDQGVPFHDIAAAIGRRLDLPVVSIPREQATEHFGHLGPVVALDSPASAAITRELLGWQPLGPGLLEDLDQRAGVSADRTNRTTARSPCLSAR